MAGALRPYVYVNVAITADGKIAPANRRFVPFSSKADQQLLMDLRTSADAVMAGARTVDLYPVNLGPGGQKYRRIRRQKGLLEYNLRVVVSGAGTLNPRSEIFKHKFSPIILLTTERIPEKNLKQLQTAGAEIGIFGKRELDFPRALEWLRNKWNVKRLLCEGGGEINAALFAAGLVHRLYLTICPIIFGGRTAPTLADGVGVKKLADATRLKLVSLRREGAELFTVYDVAKLQQR